MGVESVGCGTAHPATREGKRLDDNNIILSSFFT